MRQCQALHRTRETDVAEPPLLLDALLLERADVREDALLHPDREDRLELQPLRVVERHERDEAPIVVDRVLVRDQRDVLQEAGQARFVRLLAVLPRDADELLEVLDAAARLDRPLGLERLDRPRLLEDALHELVHRQLLRGDHERLHQRVEGSHRTDRSRRKAGRLGIRHRREERASGRLRVCDEALERGVPDSAPRPVRDAEQRAGVTRVREDAQVRGRVPDLGTLVEPRPADDLVRDVLPHEHVLEDSRLRIRPVEDRDLARRHAAVDERCDLGGDEPRLRVLVLDLDDADGVSLAEVGEEALRLALAVVLDDGVGGAEDVVRRAVVLLERDDLGAGEVALELHDVADVRAAERVDRLVRVADRADVPVLAAEELQQPVLRVVRVLVLVDEDVAERLPPARERLGEALEHFHGEHDQVVEVDGVRRVEPPLVQVVHLRDRLVPERRDALRVLLRGDELVLRVGDLVVDPARREALRILPELLEAGLDEANLVLVVVDREARAVAEPLRLAPQDPAAGRVEREDPDRPGGASEHDREALAHLPRRLVRERDGEDLVRLHAARVDQVRDAVRENACLAGARARDDENGPFGGHDGLALRVVQVREVRLWCGDGHAPMLAARSAGASSDYQRTVSSTCAGWRPSQLMRQAYVPFGSGSNDALQKNEPAAPSHDDVLVSTSGPPFGAFLPRRKSRARPSVGTRRRIRNEAGRWVLKRT